jgi:hypothetical protein
MKLLIVLIVIILVSMSTVVIGDTHSIDNDADRHSDISRMSVKTDNRWKKCCMFTKLIKFLQIVK